jgi:serine/threonine protein kinase
MSVTATLDLERLLASSVKKLAYSKKPLPVKVERLLAKGDICDLHLCSWTKPPPPPPKNPKPLSRWEILGGVDEPVEQVEQVVLKVCRGGDADLVQNEIRTLNKLYPPDQADEKFYRYLVKPIASESNALVLPYLKGFISLEEVLKAYPRGIDFLDMIWMFKRLLVAVGFAHTQKVIHGAILPSHVMVHPTQHGAKLIDWSYSVPMGGNVSIKAYPAEWKAYYPESVFEKQFPGPHTELHMAASIAIALVGGDLTTQKFPDAVPSWLQTFLLGLLSQKVSRISVWEVHEQFDKVLESNSIKPKYRKFSMPGKAAAA